MPPGASKEEEPFNSSFLCITGPPSDNVIKLLYCDRDAHKHTPYNFLWQDSHWESFLCNGTPMCAAFELSLVPAGNAYFLLYTASFCCRCRKWAFCPDIDQHPSIDSIWSCAFRERSYIVFRLSIHVRCWCDIELRQDFFNFLFDCNLWFSHIYRRGDPNPSLEEKNESYFAYRRSLTFLSIVSALGLVAHGAWALRTLNGAQYRQDLPAGFNQQSQSSTRMWPYDDSLGTLVIPAVQMLHERMFQPFIPMYKINQQQFEFTDLILISQRYWAS